MTTTVTVDAHAGWPVRVTQKHLDDDGNVKRRDEQIVPALSERVFNIHSHMAIECHEVQPSKEAGK